jgi:hypothetical protein
MTTRLFTFVMLLFALGIVSCVPATEAPTPTPTAHPGTAQALTSQPQTQQAQAQGTEIALSTAQALATLDAQATLDVASTQTAGAQFATATQEAIVGMTATAADIRKTEAAGARTATSVAKTAIADPMFALAEQLQADGLLVNIAGEYESLPDTVESNAKLNYIFYYSPGVVLSPSNFILRANLAWESASDKANWWNSGCGFLFRVADFDNFYGVWLQLDGYVEFKRQVSDRWLPTQRSYYGLMDTPKGEAEMVLIVEGEWITVLINGVETGRWWDSGVAHGDLFFTMQSGTNKDYGTRCTTTDIELWILDN